MNDDLTKAEHRWRKRRMFSRQRPRRFRFLPWLLLVILLAALVYLYLFYFHGQLPKLPALTR